MERAAQSVHLAIADFMIAILAAKTQQEALDLYYLITPVADALRAIETSALDRVDRLAGASR